MRIWDLQPGYLNRQSLLGEHRELHGIVSIIVNQKKGYANHPETRRWFGYGWALKQRHQLLAAEMGLRGYKDRSPVDLDEHPCSWPETYIDPPSGQYHILEKKYETKDKGRIPLPQNAQQLWQQHKYSVMARNIALYQTLGKALANQDQNLDFDQLALLMVDTLRQKPSTGGIRNALEHMWGYISDQHPGIGREVSNWDNERLLSKIQQTATEINQPYLISSTALGELRAWL